MTAARAAVLWVTIVCLAEGVLAFGDDDCSIRLVESIPDNMTYPSGSPLHLSTFKAWMSIINNASVNVNVSSFYWSLLSTDVVPHKTFPSAADGEAVLKAFVATASSDKVHLSVVSNGHEMSQDLTMIANAGAEVALIDVQRLLGAGILHTKMITVDSRHAYLGSANMDWRSLTQVKELGVLLLNCPTLVSDLVKIQEVYKLLSGPDSSIPKTWPVGVQTSINSSNPFLHVFNGLSTQSFFSASPPQFAPPGRSDDASTIVSIMSRAEKFIYVAVMDYLPLVLHYSGHQPNTFWPVFDNALKTAAINRGVKVRVMFSHWLHTRSSMWNYLRSLQAITQGKVSVEVSYFEVPGFRSSEIPYSRVSHTKYMVTDNTAYIGTSNWSGDYFTTTGGVGLVMEEKTPQDNSLRDQLEGVFLRDWNSDFAKSLGQYSGGH